MNLRPFLLLVLIGLSVGAAACSTPLTRGDTNASEAPALPAEHFMGQGNAAFKNGDFAAAVSSWSEAAALFEKSGNAGKGAEALTKISQACQGLGQHQEGVKAAEKALSLAQQSRDERQRAEALGVLASIRISLGENELAHRNLDEALATAKRLGDPDLTARILNTLGNLFSAQGNFQEALRAYRESTSVAPGKGSTAAAAAINSAFASFSLGDFREAASGVEQALSLLQGLEDSTYKAHGLINAGLLAGDLRTPLPDRAIPLAALASHAFAQALQVCQGTGDLRTLSYAYGHLGSLYESEARYQEALGLTRRAISYAQRSHAPESLYRWHWQSGRIFRALGKPEEAIAAYRHALANLQTIRKEMTACTGDSSFRRMATQLCSQVVDLLLEAAASMENPQAYLTEAREALELVKVFELRDYFKDDCVDAARYGETKLDLLSETALIVYPILLKDRLELLVRFPDGLKRYTVKVSAERLTQEVREFRSKIEKRTSEEFLPHGQQLYDWLIRPFEKDLAKHRIDTMVFVPDGPLRTIPMGALHNGKTFLIQNYAVAITPGLNLTDPKPLRRDQVRVLALGLTESVQDFPALPYVSSELKAIHQLLGGTSLLDQDFVVARVGEELRKEPFSILHIASHGHFGKDVDDAFVLAFDARLTMDRLGDYVGLFRFREEPLDLLTLSACETAAGDDRAALGLAGIAIRAGARSALATLWHVSDPASYRLVVEFYRRLQDPGVSRASALQTAQLALLKDPRYDHPCYWAPFLLINNWL
jgi:CHAT domain-containing protein/predicted negative regulator of RcsB-dependent stress response